jgi:hypothetical protein
VKSARSGVAVTTPVPVTVIVCDGVDPPWASLDVRRCRCFGQPLYGIGSLG